MTAAARSTPFLAIDTQILDRNIKRMAAQAADTGLVLRPHVKTHKSIEIARRQLAAGAVGITVATIGEAEVFVGAGIDDVFIAYPLWVDAPRAARLRELSRTARVRIGADSATGVSQAAQQLTGSGIEVVLEVDSGHHRSGTAPGDVAEVALAAHRHGMTVAGVFTFPGHSYAPENRATAAAQEGEALLSAANRLRDTGVNPTVISGGATPSAGFTVTEVLTEIRPGVYVFGDAQQWELGSCRKEDIALIAYGTVVSHAGGRVVLDTGSKILGPDRAAFSTGHGRLLDHPEARIVHLSEHHAVADMAGARLPGLGDVLRVVPNHVCSAVNLVDELVVLDGASVTTWPVDARGRNS
ncbi:alanine racemase [Pseudonocardia spinosispora]|uniref:alanine racemase n=1 Tax=Pseudonocardia spinosispora TaxID=103441 RepID=UPI00041F920B|nr:alanine racemase [Pseudonocardia spinosispora]